MYLIEKSFSLKCVVIKKKRHTFAREYKSSAESDPFISFVWRVGEGVKVWTDAEQA